MDNQTIIVEALRERSADNLHKLLELDLERDEILKYGLKHYAQDQTLARDYLYNYAGSYASSRYGYLYFDINTLGSFGPMDETEAGLSDYVKKINIRIQLIKGAKMHGDLELDYTTVIGFSKEGYHNFINLSSHVVNETELRDDVLFLYRKHRNLLTASGGVYQSKTNYLEDIKSDYLEIKELTHHLSQITELSYKFLLEEINNYAKGASTPVTTFSELKNFILAQTGLHETSKLRMNKTIYFLMGKLGRYLTVEGDFKSEFTFNQPLIICDGIFTDYGIMHPDYRDDDFTNLTDEDTPLLDAQPQIKQYLCDTLQQLDEVGDFTLVDYSLERHQPIMHTRYEGGDKTTVYFIDILCSEDIKR